MKDKEFLLKQINSGKLPESVLNKLKYQLAQLDGTVCEMNTWYWGWHKMQNEMEQFIRFKQIGKSSFEIRFISEPYPNLEKLDYLIFGVIRIA